MTSTRVLWARHGENVANLTRSFSHRVLDADLTDLGREQALRLAVRLTSSEVAFTGLWCSPLRRAQQTAEILGDRLGLHVLRPCDELREVNVGDLDGRNDRSAWQTYEAVLREWRSGNLDARFPGGEDGHELVARIAGALRLATHGTAGPILVVAHGANLRAALPSLTGTHDPGRDMATGSAAQLDVVPGSPAAFRLVHWPTE